MLYVLAAYHHKSIPSTPIRIDKFTSSPAMKQKEISHILLSELIFYNLSRYSTTLDLWNKAMKTSLTFLSRMFFFF